MTTPGCSAYEVAENRGLCKQRRLFSDLAEVLLGLQFDSNTGPATKRGYQEMRTELLALVEEIDKREAPRG